MTRQQRKVSQIISSILVILLPLALKVMGVTWLVAIAVGVIFAIALMILTSALSKRVQNFSSWIAYALIATSVALLIIFGIPQIRSHFQFPQLVRGSVGGERYDLLVRDSAVQKLLLNAKIKLNESSIIKQGSVEQLTGFQSVADSNNDLDFIWTGDAPLAEAGKQLLETNGKKVLLNEATLSDPLVLVVDKSAAEILATQQFFTRIDSQVGDFSYRVDTVTLADFLLGNWTWRDIGLTKYVSAPGVIMTDARKSNSGMMIETLLGTIGYNLSLTLPPNQIFQKRSRLLNSNDIAQFQPLPKKTSSELTSIIERLRNRSGFAESTSSKIKVQLTEGGLPWALTYYSLGTQITQTNTNYILVALSHTLINSNQFLSLSENGNKLLYLIQSPQFQEIARQYGYNAPKEDWIVLPDANFQAIQSLTGITTE